MPRYLTNKVMKCLRVLKAQCPLDMPVRVKTMKQADINKLHPECPRGVYGDCYVTESGIGIIRLARGMSEGVTLDVLLHEYSHLYDKGPDNFREAHRASWGEAYSKVYRAWHEGVDDE